MDIEISLLEVFEKTLNKHYPELQTNQVTVLLRENLRGKKFDRQDEILIEIILKDKANPLEESFLENLGDYINEIEGNVDRIDLLGSKEGQNKVSEIYISSLERLINYYYNLLFNSQFFTG
jgi:hypothetical protein